MSPITSTHSDEMMVETTAAPAIIVEDFSCLGLNDQESVTDSACSLNTASNAPVIEAQLPLLPLSTFSHTNTLASIASSRSSRRPIHQQLPNELLLLVCHQMPSPSLLQMRLVGKRMQSLANIILRDRMRTAVETLEASLKTLGQEHDLLEVEKRPHLRHYKQFLRNISMNDLTEATWYATPPEELKTVCECLCILKGPPVTIPMLSKRAEGTSSDSLSSSLTSLNIANNTATVDTNSSGLASSSSSAQDFAAFEPQTWASIKKQMTRYDFKNWVSNLRSNVDKIPYAAIKRVEYIIMHDQNITYERLREVSRPGYSLLIVVAACLQYGNISEEVKVKLRELVTVEERMRVGKLFLASVE